MVEEACLKYRNRKWMIDRESGGYVPKFERSPILSSRHKVLLCVAAKVGSTYFTRWMKAIDRPEPMISPLTIPISDAKRKTVESLQSFHSKEERIDFLNSATTVVFGRDPFSRIFAAYIDKLYSPNPYYWKEWGVKSLKSMRLPEERCGSDVTFTQYIRLFFSRSTPKDFHLIPIADECKICEMTYNVIGKLETLPGDLDYISKLINVSSEFQHDADYKIALMEDSMLDTVTSVFSWKRDIGNCMPLEEMGKRVWRKFQIRGIIDSFIEYPLKPGLIDSTTTATYIQLCRDAISRSTNRTKLKLQKKIALEEAFVSVPYDLIEKILKVYRLDLALFGYSQDMAFLNDEEYRIQYVKTGAFDWDSPWIVY